MTRRTLVWILGDQLDNNHPALLKAEQEDGREQIIVLLIESRQRLRKRPYQRKKLVLLLSAMRHFAAELKHNGYEVELRQAQNFGKGLQQSIAKRRPERLICMAAKDYKGRRFQQQLRQGLEIPVTVLPNQQFLTAAFDPYPDPEPGKRYPMEYFYRHMRRHFDVLMEGKEPCEGQWNFDKENRKPLPKESKPPARIGFEPDALTRQVMDEVEQIGNATGSTSGFNLPVSRAQALESLADFLESRLVEFGPYEDAMSNKEALIFHSLLSPALNLGLLRPMELIRAAEARYEAGAAPINSVEGFVRQILGWREYMYWQYWRLMPDLYRHNYWQAKRPLPGFFWTGETEMNCLHQVLKRVLESGYNHHIERLMILANFALLTGLEPLQVNEWFLTLYIDAYDWVMGPNVIGMGLHADGGLIATKPYIASANYINIMSDFCPSCVFDHRRRTGEAACPFNFLYWNFLIEHEDSLRANPRLGPNVLGLRHLDQEERSRVCASAGTFLQELAGDHQA